MAPFFRARKYFTYWLDKVNAHSLHSPYLFNLYCKAITYPTEAPAFEEIEKLRKQLLRNHKNITYTDQGATAKSRTRSIKSIAKASLSDARYSKLYYRLIKYIEPSFVVELGTSLGINTLYLSEAGKEIYTFEGAAPLALLSKKHFKDHDKDNIQLIEGNIDTTLPAFLETRDTLPFIFFDANHTYEATMRYFHLCVKKATKESIFIFDDIYWSKGMYKAWQEIKAHEAVRVTLDLYRCGIVIFNHSLTPQHLAVNF
jgi:predicted O-methyltransferase YrrM